MRSAPRTLTAVLGAAALALPSLDAASAASRTAAAPAAKKKVVTTKKVTGQPFEADRWGTVQINVTVKLTRVGTKTTRRYVNLGGSYSYHSDRSQYIMSQALPILRQEFLSAQSASVQTITGATMTSDAFVQSLQSALVKIKT